MQTVVHGIASPFSVSLSGRVVAYSSIFDSVRMAIKNILMTRKGERVMRPEFGTDVPLFVFENKDQNNIELLKMSVFNAISRWEPRAIVHQVKGAYKEEDVGLVLYIEVLYTVQLYETVTDAVTVAIRS